MAGFTNKGKTKPFDVYFRGAAAPATFYVALVTSAIAPNPDTDTLSQLTEIAAGNGYTSGGIAVPRSAVGFPTLTEDDAGDKADLTMANQAWTAAVGNLPASGAGARYAVLLDDNVVVGSRIVIAYWDLIADRTVSITQMLTVAAAGLRLKEV